MKTWIIYVAYMTCESLTKYRNPIQFSRAQTLIALNVTLHITQLVFCFFLLTNKKITKIDGPQYLFFMITGCLTFILTTLVFNKRALAKAIKRHKDTYLTSAGRLIGLSYLFLNMILCMTLFLIQSKQP